MLYFEWRMLAESLNLLLKVISRVMYFFFFLSLWSGEEVHRSTDAHMSTIMWSCQRGYSVRYSQYGIRVRDGVV